MTGGDAGDGPRTGPAAAVDTGPGGSAAATPDAGGSAVPVVSVVIPAYDRAATIRPAVESVLRQTLADIEVIVVDDGSADGTADAARRIPDPRVRVVALGENRGVSAARNEGVRAARAPWIAFQDSDDEWLPEKLALQMAALGEGDVAVYCGMAVIGTTAAGRTRIDYVPDPRLTGISGEIEPALSKGSFISTQTLVARRDAILDVGGFDEALRALVDWDLALRLCRTGRVAFVDAPLVHQRFSENSITRSARTRVEARTRIFEKYAPRFADLPGALEINARAVAGGWRRLGEPERGRAALARALAARPFDPRLRLAALALRLPRRGRSEE